MFKKAIVALVLVLAVFCVVVALQSSEFSLSRSIVIEKPQMDVFAQVNDLHAWEEWSPWAKLDPSMKTIYEGPTAGEGASYGWVGNDQVGEGKMTITKSQAPELILINLEFVRPMATTNITEFTFKPEGAGTRVNWMMSGKKNFIAKAFHLCFDMDKIVGSDFEKGLTQLKAVVESGL